MSSAIINKKTHTIIWFGGFLFRNFFFLFSTCLVPSFVLDERGKRKKEARVLRLASAINLPLKNWSKKT